MVPGIDITDLLVGAGKRQGRSGSPDQRGIPEAQIARLHEALALYRTPNPFQVGDLVTPRKGFGIEGAGDPHLVIETIVPTTPSFRSDACCGEMRFDMRIAGVTRDGELGTWWQEAWRYEPYSPPAEGAQAAPEPSLADGSVAA